MGSSRRINRSRVRRSRPNRRSRSNRRTRPNRRSRRNRGTRQNRRSRRNRRTRQNRRSRSRRKLQSGGRGIETEDSTALAASDYAHQQAEEEEVNRTPPVREREPYTRQQVMQMQQDEEMVIDDINIEIDKGVKVRFEFEYVDGVKTFKVSDSVTGNAQVVFGNVKEKKLIEINGVSIVNNTGEYLTKIQGGTEFKILHKHYILSGDGEKVRLTFR